MMVKQGALELTDGAYRKDTREELTEWPAINRDLIFGMPMVEPLSDGKDRDLGKQLMSICFRAGLELAKFDEVSEQLVAELSDMAFLGGGRIHQKLAYIKNLGGQWVHLKRNEQFVGFATLKDELVGIDKTSQARIARKIMVRCTLRPSVVLRLIKIVNELDQHQGARKVLRKYAALIHMIFHRFDAAFSPLAHGFTAKLSLALRHEGLVEARRGIQEGLDSFDPLLGVSFVVHVRWAIRNRVSAFLRELKARPPESNSDVVDIYLESDDSAQSQTSEDAGVLVIGCQKKQALERALSDNNVLSKRQAEVLRLRYYYDYSDEEISNLLGVHRETVRVCARTALTNIRASNHVNLLKEVMA